MSGSHLISAARTLRLILARRDPEHVINVEILEVKRDDAGGGSPTAGGKS